MFIFLRGEAISYLHFYKHKYGGNSKHYLVVLKNMYECNNQYE
jgi:hypothetical protein